jgi:hypothetical protein
MTQNERQGPWLAQLAKTLEVRMGILTELITPCQHQTNKSTDAISDSVEADMGSEAGEALSFSRVNAAFLLGY